MAGINPTCSLTQHDLEYLVDGEQRRVAAFGYWAGYAGAALGLLATALVAFGLLAHPPGTPGGGPVVSSEWGFTPPFYSGFGSPSMQARERCSISSGSE